MRSISGLTARTSTASSVGRNGFASRPKTMLRRLLFCPSELQLRLSGDIPGSEKDAPTDSGRDEPSRLDKLDQGRGMCSFESEPSSRIGEIPTYGMKKQEDGNVDPARDQSAPSSFSFSMKLGASGEVQNDLPKDRRGHHDRGQVEFPVLKSAESVLH